MTIQRGSLKRLDCLITLHNQFFLLKGEDEMTDEDVQSLNIVKILLNNGNRILEPQAHST